MIDLLINELAPDFLIDTFALALVLRAVQI